MKRGAVTALAVHAPDTVAVMSSWLGWRRLLARAGEARSQEWPW
jgi:hypothetical protein